MIKVLQVVLSLSLLVIIHEFGHYFFAKIFKIKVDKFFLFFDAGGVKLFSTKTSKWFVRLFPKAAEAETEYGIGWLPIGGYCKIAGMVDESMDIDSLKKEPQPWEFRTKPAWQRLLVMAGGVLFNFIFAIVVYTSLLAVNGQSYIRNEGNRIYVNDLAYEMGFRTGDEILSFDNYVPETFTELQADLARRNVNRVAVLRGADTVNIYIDRAMIGRVLDSPNMFELAQPFVIDSLQAASPNKYSGLEKGDRILSFDGAAVEYVQDSRQKLSELAGQTVVASVLRGRDTLDIDLQVDSLGLLGVYIKMPEFTRKTYSALSAIPAGFAYTFDMIGGYVSDLRLVATPSTQAYKSVGSFIAIGQVFPSSWDWLQFIYIMALLSIMLGVMNLIPIPGLDGGHILFTLYEMVSGRKPSDKFMIAAQMIGMLLLFALMFLAFGNDISRLLK